MPVRTTTSVRWLLYLGAALLLLPGIAQAGPTFGTAQALGPDESAIAATVAEQGTVLALAKQPADPGTGLSDVVLNVRPPAGDWSTPVPVTRVPASARVVGLGAGLLGYPAVVALDTCTGTSGGVLSAPATNGVDWHDWLPHTLVTTAAGQTCPQVSNLAVDVLGDAVLAWTVWTGTESDVRAAYKSAGSNVWQIDTLSTAGTSRPSVALRSDGTAVVTWAEGLHPVRPIHAAVRSLSGMWTDDVLTDFEFIGHFTTDPVATGGDGLGVLLGWSWAGVDPPYWISVYTDVDGVWQGADPAQLRGVEPQSTAESASGSALIAWRSATGVRAVTSAGGVWGPSGGEVLGDGDVTASSVDPAGDAVVSWTGSDGRLHAAYEHAGSWGGDQDVAAPAPAGASRSISMDDAGDAAVVVAGGVSLLDSSAPNVHLSAPTQAVTGTPVSVSTSATDAWSAVGTPTIDFGDGTPPVSATPAQHTYETAGTYTITAREADAGGNVGTATSTITVAQGSQAPVFHTVGVSVSGPGWIGSFPGILGHCSARCGANVLAGTTLLVEPHPGSGAVFANWTGACRGTAQPCQLNVAGDVSLSAYFARRVTVQQVRFQGHWTHGRLAGRLRVTLHATFNARLSFSLKDQRGHVRVFRRVAVRAGTSTITLALPRSLRPGRWKLGVAGTSRGQDLGPLARTVTARG